MELPQGGLGLGQLQLGLVQRVSGAGELSVCLAELVADLAQLVAGLCVLVVRLVELVRHLRQLGFGVAKFRLGRLQLAVYGLSGLGVVLSSLLQGPLSRFEVPAYILYGQCSLSVLVLQLLNSSRKVIDNLVPRSKLLFRSLFLRIILGLQIVDNLLFVCNLLRFIEQFLGKIVEICLGPIFGLPELCFDLCEPVLDGIQDDLLLFELLGQVAVLGDHVLLLLLPNLGDVLLELVDLSLLGLDGSLEVPNGPGQLTLNLVLVVCESPHLLIMRVLRHVECGLEFHVMVLYFLELAVCQMQFLGQFVGDSLALLGQFVLDL